MTEEQFSAWLDAYGDAWRARDARAAASLWTEEGVYYWGPFVPPLEGREAIREAWRRATARQQDIKFEWEMIGITPKGGVARWWCDLRLRENGQPIRHEGIFLVSLDETGRCNSFQEWWLEDPPPNGPSDRLYATAST